MTRFLRSRYQAIKPYVPGEQPRDMEKLIKLNTNENPYPPAPAARRAADEAAVGNLRLYNDIDALALREAIASHFGVHPENVYFGNGSDEVLSLSFLAFGENGAAFADLTYGFYRVWASLFGMETRVVPVREDFSIAVEEYAGLPGMVVVANPNAPTSLCLPLDALRSLLSQDVNRLVLVDEAYIAFAGQPSAACLLEEFDNLLVVGTFSKGHSLAGARLGYALARPELIGDLNRVKSSFHPYNVNSLTQVLGTLAMRDETYFSGCRDRIVKTREMTREALLALGFRVLPSRTNFLLAWPPAGTGEAYMRALREQGILVRHFQENRIENAVRITIGTAEQMETLLDATRKYLEGMTKHENG